MDDRWCVRQIVELSTLIRWMGVLCCDLFVFDVCCVISWCNVSRSKGGDGGWLCCGVLD